jgi:hypothetical protein
VYARSAEATSPPRSAYADDHPACWNRRWPRIVGAPCVGQSLPLTSAKRSLCIWYYDMPRRLPPLWSAEELPPPWFIEEHEESFVVTDANGQRIAFIYFEPDPKNDTRRTVMNRLTHDEARRIAANIAKLPALIEEDKKHTADDERKD